MRTRVHVWGASGYAAAEAIRYLDGHPNVDVGALESRSHAGEALADHFPLLRRAVHRFSAPGSVLEQTRPGDVVITAGSHGEARAIVPELLAHGARVIDLSSDFRFDREAAYGLTEYARDFVRNARLVANPGCYPTATLLALLPLARLGCRPHAFIVDAKSGISGAGRNPSVAALFAEVAGDVRAYGLDGHRHHAEIVTRLEECGLQAEVVFTPHVVPLARGMIVDAYAVYAHEPDPDEVRAAYASTYGSAPFVRVVDGAPSVAAVNGTNDAEVRVDTIGSAVRAICVIDNLGKGAAGQAVQNLNIMQSYAEDTGFHARAVVA